MENRVILTTKIDDALKLRTMLSNIDKSFNSVNCLSKEMVEQKSEYEYIFSTWDMPVFSTDEINLYFPKLKAIFYSAGTVKYFAIPFLNSGIRVFSAASANGIPVAEFTAAQIVLANKGFIQAQKAYNWPIWKRGFRKARHIAEEKNGNYNSTIGIIGCGAIGSRVVELLDNYKLKIKVYDPYISQEKVNRLKVQSTTLEDIFSTCDVITNHLPNISETVGIINYDLLKLLKPNATFINTGRGQQVNEKDLAKVMRKKPKACAILDVTSHEPLYPWSPLYWCKNVVLTPHIAGSLGNEIARMAEYMVNAWKNVENGEDNPCEVYIEQLKNHA